MKTETELEPALKRYLDIARETEQKALDNMKFFTLNKEVAPLNENMMIVNPKTVDFVDFKAQRGGFVRIFGRHPSAAYIIRINEGSLDIWRDYNANGFNGPLNSISSWRVEEGKPIFEEGIMRLKNSILMPYFKYDRKKLETERLELPSDYWYDSCYSIHVGSEMRKR